LSPKRIRLKDDFRLKLFENTLSKTNLSLFELSKKLNCSYSGIKTWRSGGRLIPEDVFTLLLNISDEKIRNEAHNNIVSRYDSNWGAKLGGDNSYKNRKKQIYSNMRYIRSFRQSPKIPKDSEIDTDIWELIGICLGDGCLSKYFSKYENRWQYEVLFTGNLKDDTKYYEDCIIPILRSKFDLRTNYHARTKENVIYIAIKSKRIFNFFKLLGMPVGKKKDKIRITNTMFNSSSNIKAAILRGLLDTDGHIFARKDEDYKYPHLKITSASNKFLNDIKILINEFNMPAYIHGDDVLIRGSKNLKKWMKIIGSSHPINNYRYKQWLETGKLLPKHQLSFELPNIQDKNHIKGS